MNKYFKASANPIDDIDAVAYAGQDPQRRMYKSGYEDFFELLPVLRDGDPFLDLKFAQTDAIMSNLAMRLRDDKWTPTLKPLDGGFNRTILAIEEPSIEVKVTGKGFLLGESKEGAEIVLARWGNGFTSPVHGHGDGMLYEQLIFGTMRVNTYRITDPVYRVVRPVETRVYKGFQNIASQYTPAQTIKRGALVHNFTSIGYSASLHFVPEHTRDGRDNQFVVDHFDQEHQFSPEQYFQQLTTQQGIEQLRIGDVALVRSENVPEYGDHFIVITGKPVLKEHGYRPQEVAIHAPHAGRILDKFNPIMGLTLLKLRPHLAEDFRNFHGIVVEGDSVKFPKA